LSEGVQDQMKVRYLDLFFVVDEPLDNRLLGHHCEIINRRRQSIAIGQLIMSQMIRAWWGSVGLRSARSSLPSVPDCKVPPSSSQGASAPDLGGASRLKDPIPNSLFCPQALEGIRESETLVRAILLISF